MTVEIPAPAKKTNPKLLLATTTEPDVVSELVARETRDWGIALMLMGGLHFVSTVVDLDPVWGVALILIGAASFYFRSAAMLAVYGVTLAWVAVMNLLSGDIAWMAFAVLQVYLAFRTFQQFAMVRRAAVRLGIGIGAGSADRAAPVFPWAGCALTTMAGIGLPAFLLGYAIYYGITEQDVTTGMFETVFAALVDLGALGMAFAVAALLARYRFRVVSILAASGAALVLLGFVVLALMPAS